MNVCIFPHVERIRKWRVKKTQGKTICTFLHLWCGVHIVSKRDWCMETIHTLRAMGKIEFEVNLTKQYYLDSLQRNHTKPGKTHTPHWQDDWMIWFETWRSCVNFSLLCHILFPYWVTFLSTSLSHTTLQVTCFFCVLQIITVYTIPGMDCDWLVGEKGDQKGKVPITYLELLSWRTHSHQIIWMGTAEVSSIHLSSSWYSPFTSMTLHTAAVWSNLQAWHSFQCVISSDTCLTTMRPVCDAS